MNGSFENTNNRYTQARDAFRAYSSNFIEESASGIISNRKIRKLNTMSVWFDYIQKYLNSVSNNTLYETSVTYKDLDHLLDLIAFELKINYTKKSKLQAQSIASSKKTRSQNTGNTHIESELDTLLTEKGEPLEIESLEDGEGQTQNNSNSPTNSSNVSSSY